jgi:hypothetical protein
MKTFKFKPSSDETINKALYNDSFNSYYQAIREIRKLGEKGEYPLILRYEGHFKKDSNPDKRKTEPVKKKTEPVKKIKYNLSEKDETWMKKIIKEHRNRQAERILNNTGFSEKHMDWATQTYFVNPQLGKEEYIPEKLKKRIIKKAIVTTAADFSMPDISKRYYDIYKAYKMSLGDKNIKSIDTLVKDKWKEDLTTMFNIVKKTNNSLDSYNISEFFRHGGVDLDNLPKKYEPYRNPSHVLRHFYNNPRMMQIYKGEIPEEFNKNTEYIFLN